MSSTNLEKEKINKYKNNFILVNINGFDGFPHFTHVMEYFYYAVDKMLQYPEHLIIIIEPKQYYGSTYVNTFLKYMNRIIDNHLYIKSDSNIINNLKITKIYEYKHNKDIDQDTFTKAYINVNTLQKHDFYNWFLYKNSNKMRDLFFPKHTELINHRIGIINRRNTRKLSNIDNIIKTINEQYNIPVDVTYFENETFENQLKFFRNHNIIIVPHGAALINTPFLPNNALIIEFCHDEWHPYYYFPGLSHSCNNYHALVCNTPDVFPIWYSNDYNGNQKKFDIVVDINKLKIILDMYINNNFKEKNCYLF